MSDPPSIGRSPRAWQFRLWHLAVGVLVAAPLLGLLRAEIVNQGGRSMRDVILGWIARLGVLAIFGASFLLGSRQSHRISLAVSGWTERRGRPGRVLAPMVGVLAHLVVGLGTIGLGSIAVAAWVGLLVFLSA